MNPVLEILIRNFAFMGKAATLICVILALLWGRSQILTATLDRKNDFRRYVQRGNVPITFYGRVIAENGAGLKEVSIGYKVQRGEALLDGVKVHTDSGTVLSGADGSFEISKRSGSSLTVGPSVKDGYRDAQRDVRSFGYMGTAEPHESDQNKPVLFVMVKNGAPGTKDIGHKTLKFAWNQGAVRIPLGNKLGDFVIVPTRGRGDGELRNFDWTVKVAMADAELVALGSDHAPIAPAEGYKGSFEYGARNGDAEWRGGLQATYAFRTSGGLYGIARLVIYPARDDSGVNGSLKVGLNETGSRNLD
jgi:hypothetical protein